MKTQEIINAIKSAPLKHLSFTTNGTQLVPDHYHITEIKQVSTRSVDCGGFAHNDEHIEVQLWLAKQQDDGHRINNADIAKIVSLVNSKLEMDTSLPIFFEYSDEFNPTAKYKVTNISEDAERILFDLEIPKTVCKPRLALEESGCAPGSGCC